MRVVTNTNLVRRNRKIPQYLFFVSFGVPLFAIFATFQAQPGTQSEALLIGGFLPTVVLVIALIATLISVRLTNLWIRPPRPETVIHEGLKGISPKSVLYNYYHFPARHVLISPQGVFAIVTRYQEGRFTVQGDRWKEHKTALSRLLSFFRFDSIGDPSFDAVRAAQHVKRQLEPIAPDVEVKPVIVFVDPRVQVEIIDPTVPVVFADSRRSPSLKDYVLSQGREGDKKRATLTPAQIEAFEQATISA